MIFPLTTLTTVNAEKIPTIKCATLDFQVFLRLLGAAPLARSPSVSAPTMPASFPHRDGATNSPNRVWMSRNRDERTLPVVS